MDEARRLLERLRRIDALHREGAGAAALLAEVERLLDEARPWLAPERGAGAAADRARAREAVVRM